MRALLRRLWWLAIRQRKEDELREELDFHLAEEAGEYRAAGLSEDEARSAARRDLGHIPLVVEDTRAVWGWIVLEQAGQDLRYAIRALARSPSFTFAALITLALGIGLTTAVFSVVHGVLLRPLAFAEADRLVVIDTVVKGGPREGGISPPNFMSLREEKMRTLPEVGGVLTGDFTLTGAGEPRTVAGARVSAELFDILRVRPIAGRTFRREENEPGSEQVVLLSYGLWQQQFGGDPGTIGRTILLDGIPRIVIGIMAPAFDFPGGRALWVPLEYGRNYFSAATAEGRKNNAYVRVLGRLQSNSTLEAARAELEARGRALEQRFPDANAGVTFTAVPLHEDLVEDIRTPLLLLFGAVGFVLLIAATNVAGLLLARATSRREEIALRGALGAGRARIVRQLVTESLLMGLAGGAAGLLLAWWAASAAAAAHVHELQAVGRPGAIRVDGTVLAFALGITILTAVLAGLLPAMRAADDGLRGALQSAGRGAAARSGGRLRSALVIGQLALAVVLLYGAGLLFHSFVRLASVDPGFHTEKILSFHVDLPGAEYGSNDRIRAFFSRLMEGIERRPGIEAAGAISRVPIWQAGAFRSRFRLEGMSAGDAEPSIGARLVTPGYFRTMGVAVLKGRGFSAQDRVGSAPVVLINQAAAARFFPGSNPIGRRLLHFSWDPLENAADSFTIVGVVADVRSRGLSEPPQPEAYFPHAQVPLAQMFVVVRTGRNPAAHVAAIRNELRTLDSNLPVPVFRTLDQVVADSIDRPRFFTTLLTLFSGIALLLAAVGIFGTLSFSVARRTHEIGVRLALGAPPRLVAGSIVGEAFVLALIGLGIGLAGALGFGRMLRNELFDIRPTDAATLAGVIVALGATTMATSIVPAWRAARVDPLVALRTE